VVEVLATDDDDRSKGNGPSFVFRMDPNAADIIRASFKVEHDPSKLLVQKNCAIFHFVEVNFQLYTHLSSLFLLVLVFVAFFK
jgi:hypothetical protein